MQTKQPNVRIETRPGWTRKCPNCKADIAFTKLVNSFDMTPFYYSDGSNDVLFRTNDRNKIRVLMSKGQPSVEQLASAWNEILKTAPPAPSGGTFSLWANIKCPFCKTEFPYNNGVKDLRVRLYDPHIVLIEGAVVVEDTVANSWKVCVSLSWDRILSKRRCLIAVNPTQSDSRICGQNGLMPRIIFV